MAIIQNCCCFNNVRTGSLAAAIYTLVLSLITGGLMTLTLLQLEVLHDDPSQTKRIQTDRIDVAVAWFFSTLVISVLLFLTSIILIIAVQKDKRFIMIPWLVITVLLVIMDTAALIFDCVIFGMLTLNIIQMVVWLALTLLNVYAILCVISQYQELKAGRGTREYHRRRRPMIMYQPAIQQVHITQGPIMVAFPGTLTSSTLINQHNPGQTDVTTTLTMLAPPDYNVANDLPRYSVATGMRSRHASAAEPACPTYKKTDEVCSMEQNDKADMEAIPNTPPPHYQP